MIPVESKLVAALAPIHVNEETGCWEWLGAQQGAGYGFVYYKQQKLLAHRLSWELTNGPIAPDLTIDHLCRNRLCVNPAHLEPVTMAVNNARSDSRSGKNSRKTHCDYGHPFSDENTYFRPDGKGRNCLTCMRRRKREWRQRNHLTTS